MSNDPSGGLVVLAVLLGLYFLPTIVAMGRHVENKSPTFIVNLFLGWTFIGWVVALAMGAGAKVRDAAVQPQSELRTIVAQIVSGAKTPIGKTRVVAPRRTVVLWSPTRFDITGHEVTEGDSLDVFETRGEFTLIRTERNIVGWIPNSAIFSTASTIPTTKVCPQCAETVQAAAKVCRFCRHDFAIVSA